MATSEITITEQGGLKRQVVLRGAGLPKRGANWGGGLRAVTTWYPGNYEATQQVMGPFEAPTQWAGEWNTTRLLRTPCQYTPNGGSPQDVVLAPDLRSLLEDIFRRGSLLLVVWKNQLNDLTGPREITRTGRCTTWDFKYDRIEDIPWSMTFEWTGRGRPQQRVIDDVSNGIASGLFQLEAATFALALAVDTTKIQQSRQRLPKSANRFTLGQAEALLDGPNQLMRDLAQKANLVNNRVKRFGDLVNKIAVTPFEITNQALDVATNLVATCNTFVDKMSSIPPEQMDTQQKLAGLTRAASYYGDGVKQAQYTADQATKARYQIAQNSPAGASGKNGNAAVVRQGVTAQRSPLAVYLVRQGDTLMSISVKFYGGPAGVFDICKSNALPFGTISPPVGRVLVIPQLSTLEGQLNANTGKLGVPAPDDTPTPPGGAVPGQGGSGSLV